MVFKGNIVREQKDGFVVFVPSRDYNPGRNKRQVLVEVEDGRCITSAQRRKIFVLLTFISEWSGYTPLEVMKELMKCLFQGTGYGLKAELFSLSVCSLETARLFITFLIDFIVANGIKTDEPLWELTEDIPRYVWACLMNKRCAVCGRKAELHHVDAVGAGRNRKEICHIGMRCLPLCREHHTEIHQAGTKDFCKWYILEPVRIDEKIAGVYKLKRK